MTWPDMWSQRMWVSICKLDGSWVDYHTIIETVDVDEGDKDIEEKFNIGGGRMVKDVPQPMTTITFEAYEVGIGTTSGDNVSFTQPFTGGTYDATGALSRERSHTFDKFRVALLWTNQVVSTAYEGIDASSEAYRYSADEVRVTSHKQANTDNEKKSTIMLKIPQFNKEGLSNIVEEDCTASQTLDALSVYT